MNSGQRALRACAWCGVIFPLVFFAGALLAHIIPPFSPSKGPSEVTIFWSSHADLKRLGLVLMMLAAGLTAPWGAAICVHVKRIEGTDSPLTWLQAFGAATGVIAILMPTLLFMAASYRPERDPKLLQLVNDMGWIPFVVNVPPALMQTISLGFATLSDRSEAPLFPRWFGYYNFWSAFVFMPGALILFFKHGAFAWNGLLAFWLVAVFFGAWFIVVAVMMLRANPKPLRA